MKVDKDWVNAYFDHGIDLSNRRVFLDTDIGEASISSAVKGLYLMETESREKPVEIFISSYGGCLYEALALYDIMNTISCPLHTFAYGKCMSAAPLLLASGEPGYRWVAPNVAFMHHDWSGHGVDGSKGTQMIATVKHYEELGKKWLRLLAKHSNKDYKWWDIRSKKSDDFYFSADEAIDWGLADQIWVEKQ
jgi:ATP-dependent Clp protease protease subunit